MAIKTVLATTPTTATISVSGDLTFDNFVDIDIDVDTLGRDETASNPEVLINQVDYDINAPLINTMRSLRNSAATLFKNLIVSYDR